MSALEFGFVTPASSGAELADVAGARSAEGTAEEGRAADFPKALASALNEPGESRERAHASVVDRPAVNEEGTVAPRDAPAEAPSEPLADRNEEAASEEASGANRSEEAIERPAHRPHEGWSEGPARSGSELEEVLPEASEPGAAVNLESTVVGRVGAVMEGERARLTGTAPGSPREISAAAGEAETARPIGSERPVGEARMEAPRLRIEPDLSLVDPELRARLERVVERMRLEFGHNVRVIEAYRSPQRQEALYAQGRTAPGPVVTWTRSSLHTEGLAVDVMVDGSFTAHEGYRRLAAIAEQEGLQSLWPKDPGHLQLPAQASSRVAAAAELVAQNGRGMVGQAGTARAAPVAEPARVASVASPADVAQPAQVAVPGGTAPAAATITPDGAGGRLAQVSPEPHADVPVLADERPIHERELRAVRQAGEPGRTPAGEPTPPERAATERVVASRAQPYAHGREDAVERVGRRGSAAGGATEAAANPGRASIGVEAASRAALTVESAAAASAAEPRAAGASAGSLLIESAALTSPESLHRVSQIRELQELAYPRRLGQLTVRMMDGLAEEARMRVRLEDGGVSTRIGVRDLGHADMLRTRIGLLEQSLRLQGIAPLSVRVGALTVALDATDSSAWWLNDHGGSDSNATGADRRERGAGEGGREGRRSNHSRNQDAYEGGRESYR